MQPNRKPRTRGLTMIELMCALAIIGIVLAATLPSLQAQMRQGRRVDAMQALALLQLAQERWRAEHPGYATDLASLGQAARSPGGHYGVSIAQADAGGYTLVAQALSASQQGDRACTTFTLQVTAGRTLAGSTDAGGAPDLDNGRRCWVM
jgi:type IV pilus assembly protein PilE